MVMTDYDYLRRAIYAGHLCPKCSGDYLRLFGYGAVCPVCAANFGSWKDLFMQTAEASGWDPSPQEAWQRWLESHPDYTSGE